ncbi:MAG: FmdB family zinc ribbon protein [Acidobacteriota bacterium]
MPIYEYQCTECDRRFETLQRMSDPPLTICETCGGALKKLISAPAVQFKGDGWYVTDYAGKKGPKKDGPGEAAGGGGSDAGGESSSGGSSDSAASKSSSDGGSSASAPASGD